MQTHTFCLLSLHLQIIWENRKKGDTGNDCLVTVDGTDCRVTRQGQGGETQAKAFKSHKFNGNGVRYEVCICILTGDIVWVLGPFPCGDWPDIVIFRFALKQMLDEFERVEADDGYVGEDPLHVKAASSAVHDQDAKMRYVRGRVRMRQETVNKRLKQFNVLKDIFRHDVEFHGACFRACAVLTQLSINNGNPLFSTDEYKDNA
jgi:hypothetical protein